MKLTYAFVFARLFRILALLSFTEAALAESNANIFNATYKGEISGWNVEMHRSLRQVGANQYEFASEAKNMFASIREASLFQVTDQLIRPLSYEYQRKVFGRKVRETIEFDWTGLKADYRRSDRSQNNRQHRLQPGLLDPALYQLLLQRDMYRGKKEPSYSFVKRGSIKNYDFSQVGSGTFDFRGKPLNAIILEKRDKDESTTTIWLIPELDYQIGKLIHVDEDGSTYQVQLADYKSNPQALKAFYDKTPETKIGRTEASIGS